VADTRSAAVKGRPTLGIALRRADSIRVVIGNGSGNRTTRGDADVDGERVPEVAEVGLVVGISSRHGGSCRNPCL
jgi:hypothetical protein